MLRKSKRASCTNWILFLGSVGFFHSAPPSRRVLQAPLRREDLYERHGGSLCDFPLRINEDKVGGRDHAKQPLAMVGAARQSREATLTGRRPAAAPPRPRCRRRRGRGKRRGQHMGRPQKLTDPQRAEAGKRRAEGATLKYCDRPPYETQNNFW
jgi:hypothetical protein